MSRKWTRRAPGLKSKLWKSPLAMAITAGMLAGMSYMPSAFAEQQVADGTLSYSQYITATTADTDYVNGDLCDASIATNQGTKYSTYIFKGTGQNLNTLEIQGVKVTEQFMDVGIRAKDIPNLNVKDGVMIYLHDNLFMKADNMNIGATKQEAAVFADGGTITLDGNVNVDSQTKGLVAYLDAITADFNESGTYSTGKLTVNGNAVVESVGHAVQASGGEINITGNVDLHSTEGIALRASSYRAYTTESYYEDKQGSVNINGGSIVADKYDAIHNKGSNVYLNNSGTNTLTIKGDMVMLDYVLMQANTVLKLTDADSSWEGGLYTGKYMLGVEPGYENYQSTNLALTLQNGATWTNVGENFNAWGGTTGDENLYGLDFTSTVNNFIGGSDEAHAGVIKQETSRTLTLDNYSGYTKIIYSHTGDGTFLQNYNGGDVVVGSAAEGSHIDMITDNSGIGTSAYSINTVLNNLASKLVYEGAIVATDKETENNLSATAIIAEGLTASSSTLHSDKIEFNSETGRGYLGNYISQGKTEFTTTLTGVGANDTEYIEANVLQEAGDYRFSKDSSINVNGANAVAIKLAAPATIIGNGTALTLNVTEASGDAVGIINNVAGDSVITAAGLNINVAGSGTAVGVQQIKGTTQIDAPVNIKVSSTSKDSTQKTLGIAAYEGILTVNGDVDVTVESNGIGYEQYGASGIYATGKGGSNKGAQIDINGKLTYSGYGNGVTSNMGGATVNVAGADITVDKDNTMGYAALRAEDGIVNVNVVRDEAGKVTAADSNDVNIKGNVVLANGAIYAGDTNGYNSAINLGLTTYGSTLTGVIQNQYGLNGQQIDGYNDDKITFTGEANLWLQNGATWYNEEYGSLKEPSSYYPYDEYNGSLVSNFVGGSNVYAAGNIYQNDSNPLTIGNYSGYTNIFYAHTNDGTSGNDYAAGDTIIKHAAEGSEVHLLTDSTNITLTDRTQVYKVIAALAGKLVYEGYVDNERNLAATVGIAEGLTSSSEVKVVKGVQFNEEDGRGYFKSDEIKTSTLTSPLTGTNADEEYFMQGVTNDYADYYFNPLDYDYSAITINAAENSAGIIFNSGHDVYVSAPSLGLNVVGGITAARNKENPWQGSYLSIDTINEEGAAGTVTVTNPVNEKGAIEATADVRIYGKAAITSANNGIYAGIVGTNGGSVEITKGTTINAEGKGLVADGGSITLDSANNSIIAKGDAIYAKGVEVNPKTNLNEYEQKLEDAEVEGDAGGWNENEKYGETQDDYHGITQSTDPYYTGGYVYVEGGKIASEEGNAVTADHGTVYINVGGDYTTNITGNIVLSNESVLDLKLSDADSTWNGNLLATDSSAAITVKNGATWVQTNAENMTVNTLNGSDTETDAAAGNIYRNGTGELTVGYLNGAINLYYAHTGDGDKAEDYAAGDTHIKSAEGGSVVTVITDKNANFDAEKLDTYKEILNTLAGKLYYDGYVSGERNIYGYVGIAEGLTTSSVLQAVKTITFSEATGQGAYIEVYEQGITGSADDTRYVEKGDVNEDFTEYNFGEQGGAQMRIPSITLQQIDTPQKVTVNSVENLGISKNVYVSAENELIINAPNTLVSTSYANAFEAAGGKITINGSANVSANAKGFVADAVVKTEAQQQTAHAGELTVTGEVYAVTYGLGVLANGGIVNINTDGQAKWVLMNGFLAGQSSELGTESVFNIVLNNDDSRWEGRIRVDQDAQVNLTLQNGGTWADYRKYQSDIGRDPAMMNNRVADLTGGDSDETAGIIRITDYVPLYLDNVSGNTIIHYSHLMGYDGTDKSHYFNGLQKADVHVGSAQEGAVITVMTESDDIDLNNQDTVNKVLNTLASFLYYDGYVTGERTLTGRAAIAESLAGSSLLLANKTATEIEFNETTGQGYYTSKYVDTVFDTPITGTSEDTEYSDKGVVTEQDPMTDAYIYNNYNFEPSATGNIVVPAINVTPLNKTLNITAEGENLVVDGGISTNGHSNLTINSAAVSMDTKAEKAIAAYGAGIAIKGDLNVEGTGKGIVAERIQTYEGGSASPAGAAVTVEGKTVIDTVGTAVEALGASITLKDVADLSSETDTVVLKASDADLTGSTGLHFYSPSAASLNMVGGSITAESGNAIYAEGATVNLNTEGANDLIVKGDVALKSITLHDFYGDLVQYYGSYVNMNLTTADSSWTGSLMNDGNTMNLKLTNGATWTDAVVEGAADNNVVNTFTGSSGEEVAGNIYRNDVRDLTINNYSGNTNIFYAHAEDDATSFSAGNTIIKSAAEGSKVTMMTQKAGIDLDNNDAVTSALNALAGKLYYTGYNSGAAMDAQNLTGKLAIAEGLTTSEITGEVKDIVFNPYTGQGTYGQGTEFIPPTQQETEFTQKITGQGADVDVPYYTAGVLQPNGSYIFTKDSNITTSSAAIITSTSTNIDATGKTLNLTANANEAIRNNGGTLNITADTLNVNMNGTGKAGAITIQQGGSGNIINITGDVNLKATTTSGSSNAIYGIGIENSKDAQINIYGNLTIKGEDDAWGLDNGDTGYGASNWMNTGTNGIYTDKGQILIDGNVDLKVNGSAVVAGWSNSSRIDITGGGTIVVNKEITQDASNANKGNYALEASGGGHVTMNYKDGEAGDNKVNILGNIGMFYPNNWSQENSSVILAMTTADSTWTGVMHNAYTNTTGITNNHNSQGEATLYLQNGATWTNEQWGDIYQNKTNTNIGEYTGSIWENFIGGASAAKAGNIFQKDSKNITLGNYSGYTNIYYSHDAEDVTTMIGGDTIIGQAAEGSAITLITDQSGITQSDADQVKSVLNALAGKLVYTANDGNLAGTVKIAESLTVSAAELISGDIDFDASTGRGSYGGMGVIEEPVQTITTPQSGKNVEFTYDKNTVITVENSAAIYNTGNGNVKVNASGHDLTLDVKADGDARGYYLYSSAMSSRYPTIKADNFNVKLEAGGNSSAIEQHGAFENTVTANVSVQATTAEGKTLNGIYCHAYNGNYGKFNINGDLTMKNGDTWGVTNGNTATDSSYNYGVTGIYAEGKDSYYGYGNTVTVSGKTDLKIDGTAVVTRDYGEVTLSGASYIEVNKDAAEGTANYALETNGSGTIAVSNAKDIKGNIGVLGGGTIKLTLDGEDASWTGVSHNNGGETNITLKNGANWTNEQYGETWGDTYTGSNVKYLYGGSDAASAGNIYQKDSNALTISSLSGYVNVYYEHATDTPMTMIGGDTVINGTYGTAGVTMITENNGVTDANAALVLNALANKLVYSGSGLDAKVQIAEGLTGSGFSTEALGITFESGRGTYNSGTALMTADVMPIDEGGEDTPAPITTPIVAEGTEVTATAAADIHTTTDGTPIIAKSKVDENGIVTPATVALLAGGNIYSGEVGEIYGTAVYAEGATVALNPEGGSDLVIKGDVVLKGISGEDTVAPSMAIITLDTEKSSFQGNIYNDEASSVAMTLANGAIWNNRDSSREDELGITGHTIASFTGGVSAEKAGNLFQNNDADLVINSFGGYVNVYYGHLNDGTSEDDFSAGNIIINSAEVDSGITLITNRSYNIDSSDEAQVNTILNNLAGKLWYTGYADGERNLSAKVALAESLTGSGAIITSGDLTFNNEGQGYFGKAEHIAGIYTTDITGSAADTEYLNAGVTEDFITYDFTDTVEGDSKVILQGIKVAGDTENYKDSKDVNISIKADTAELNGNINVGYRGQVAIDADTVTINGVSGYAIDNNGGTLNVTGDVNIADVKGGIHTSSKTDVLYDAATGITNVEDYIGTVEIEGAANINAIQTAIATEGGHVSVGAGSNIVATEGDAIVATATRLLSVQVGYTDKEVAGIVEVAGGNIEGAYNAINVAGGQVYVNAAGGNDTTITGNIVLNKDTTNINDRGWTQDAPQASIVGVTLDTESSSFNGNILAADDSQSSMQLKLANGATWNNVANEAMDGYSTIIDNFMGGEGLANAGIIMHSNAGRIDINNYSGAAKVYMAHETDGQTTEDYAAGDVIVRSAAQGSEINLITDSKNVAMDDADNVATVLNALAGKLYFYGEEQEVATMALAEDTAVDTPALKGTVTIAEGLTSASAALKNANVLYKGEEAGNYFGQGYIDKDSVEDAGGQKPGSGDAEISHGAYETATMRAVKSTMASANLMWRAENNDLMQRMGDLRVLDGERGMWAKYYTGKFEMDAQNANMSTKYKAFQLGYDTKVNENWTVGAAVSYDDGSSSTSNASSELSNAWGHGDQKNVALGMYGTWRQKDGQYADIVVKLSRLNNDYELKFNNGIGTYDIDGDYNTWGTSISAEYGKRFEGANGTYFEPSAELTYGHMNGKSYSATTNYANGTKLAVSQDAFDTLIGRIGLRLGQKLNNGSYFAKLAVAHEFMGDFDTSFLEEGVAAKKASIDFGDTWYELQIGGTAKLSDNSMFYADVQRSFGGDVTEKWRVDAGLRFTF